MPKRQRRLRGLVRWGWEALRSVLALGLKVDTLPKLARGELRRGRRGSVRNRSRTTFSKLSLIIFHLDIGGTAIRLHTVDIDGIIDTGAIVGASNLNPTGLRTELEVVGPPVLILPVDVVFDGIIDLGGGFGNMPDEGRGDVIGCRYVLGVVRNEGDVRGWDLLLLGLGGLVGNESMIILAQNKKRATIENHQHVKPLRRDNKVDE